MHIIAVSAIISWFHAPCESVLLYKVQSEFRRSCIICAELIDEGIAFLYFFLPKNKSKSENKKKKGKHCRHAVSSRSLSFYQSTVI